MTSKELRLLKTPQQDGFRAKKQATALFGNLLQIPACSPMGERLELSHE